MEYVEAHIAMQQFERELERTDDFAAAVLAITDEKFRRRVVEYGEYGKRHRVEFEDSIGLRGCFASFIGPELEALTCGGQT